MAATEPRTLVDAGCGSWADGCPSVGGTWRDEASRSLLPLQTAPPTLPASELPALASAAPGRPADDHGGRWLGQRRRPAASPTKHIAQRMVALAAADARWRAGGPWSWGGSARPLWRAINSEKHLGPTAGKQRRPGLTTQEPCRSSATAPAGQSGVVHKSQRRSRLGRAGDLLLLFLPNPLPAPSLPPLTARHTSPLRRSSRIAALQEGSPTARPFFTAVLLPTSF